MNLVAKLNTLSIFVVVGCFTASAGAQSKLEELEKKIGEYLKQPPAAKKTQQGELPAPASKPKPATPAQPGPTLELPNDPTAGPLVVPAPASASESASETASYSGYLGIEAEPVIGGGIGVRVSSVADGSPAWKAGFKIGDVIGGIDGFAIANLDGMVARLAKRSPGQSVKFLVLRGDRNFELTAVLQDASVASRIQGPLNLGAQAGSDVALDPSAPAWLGLAVSDLSPEFRRQFGISAYRGAAVTDVVANSPADLAQIKPGDAIVEVNGRAIDSAKDVLAFVAQAKPGQLADLLVFRGASARQKQLVLSVDPRISASRTSRFPPANPFQAQTDASLVPDSVNPSRDLQNEVRALREELRKSREQLNNLERRMDQLLDLISQGKQ